jgi:hypothetical protein
MTVTATCRKVLVLGGAAGWFTLLPMGAAAAADAAAPSVSPAKPPASKAAPARSSARGTSDPGTPSTTIYQSRLPDGTLELSDQPPPAGASGVAQHRYTLPPDAVARERAQAERDYWRQQAEAFEKRRVERERDERRAARVAPTTIVVADPYPRRYASNIWGWPQYEGGFATPLPGIVGGVPVSPVYSSSPGAVQGRDAGGFIGSGFSSAR